ncbi:MFS transporter [Beijerinckia indica]|uniref:Major facilitator superfamily MFS_1 n=1 Tax=Beijerinckia indica subsp. indica (strain ATCC 9039 / DSM 1715 / NCIMB 8712) TaxID=395963 RepID=B2II31_BEII9|nr:MFS transporter [Beijerinckia indica]ACB94614.1 major facilitator superfamily MFS_1 [Beijerinckia indica subsp. indica ATCC 9039]
MQITQPASAATTSVGKGLLFAMAASCGIAVANIYYNQPMLGVIEDSFDHAGAAGLIPTATQLGYAAGLFLLVPLGDLVERRRLIVMQFALLGIVLALAGLAPSAWTLVIASLCIGFAATVAQQIIPFAASLAPASERGAVIGTVMGGLLCGILLSRTLAGYVATYFGWREMFWIGVPLALIGGVLMRVVLPLSQISSDIRYPALIRSLAGLWQDEPILRQVTIVQAALFASFTAFWTILALRLQGAAFHLGADVAGLFGFVGAVGILAAPMAGHLADRRGPRPVVLLGLGSVLLAWILFGVWTSLVGLVVGVVVLDFGMQSALVSHQHMVFALRPEARSRLNTIFMSGMFVGGAIGSAGATFAWNIADWPGVCVYGTGLALFALAVRLLGGQPAR